MNYLSVAAVELGRSRNSRPAEATPRTSISFSCRASTACNHTAHCTRPYTLPTSKSRLVRKPDISNNVLPVKPFLSALLSFHLKEFFSFVFFLVLSSLHRRPRLVRNLSGGFSPTQTSLRSKLRP